MLSKCANPDCSATFRYLHEGRVFRVEPGPIPAPARPTGSPAGAFLAPLLAIGKEQIAPRPNARPEYFWLCAACSEHMKVGTDHNGVVLVRIAQARAATASAPAA